MSDPSTLSFALDVHGERHGQDGDDPVTPQMIGAEPFGAAAAAAAAAESAITDAVAGLAPFDDDGDVLDQNANVLARADLTNVDPAALDAAVSGAFDPAGAAAGFALVFGV